MSDETPYEGPTFKEAELEGWQAKAGNYDDLLGQVTNRAIGPLLDAAGVGAGTRVLDVACGPGYGAGGAAARGANAVGLDLAPNMVAEAARNFPDADFRVGEGDALPFGDGDFDAVVSSFGIMHMPDPDDAIAEARRVLAPGGRYAFTVWAAAEKHPYLSLVAGAVKAHGDLGVALPPAPDLFRFSDPGECERTLTGAGFTGVTAADIPLTWRTATAEGFLAMIRDSLVRTAMLMEGQEAGARERIDVAIVEAAAAFKVEDGYEIGWPAVVVSATKP